MNEDLPEADSVKEILSGVIEKQGEIAEALEHLKDLRPEMEPILEAIQTEQVDLSGKVQELYEKEEK